MNIYNIFNIYTFIKGAAYMGDNQMYSPALISIPYELEETIKASGVQFYVLNKPGIPIYRKIEKLSNGKNILLIVGKDLRMRKYLTQHWMIN